MSELTSLFLKVQDQKEKGKDVVEMHVGEPAMDTPPKTSEAGIRAIKEGKTYYTSPFGSKELRQMIARKYSSASSKNVLVSTGGRVVLSGIFYSFLKKGDKVIIPSPYYPSFREQVEYFGGEPVLVDTSEDDFLLRASTVEEKLQEKGVPRFLIINTPNNPAGTVYSHQELEKIIKLSREWGFGIIFDECYHHFSSFNIDFTEMCPEAIIVNSYSKTYAMTGWRVGWAVAPADTINRMQDFFRQVIGSISSISQEAAMQALRTEERIEDFSEQGELIKEWLADLDVPCPTPQGGFYVFPDFSRFFGKEITNSIDLAHYLLEKAGVAVAPGEFFGNYPSRLRLAYCINKEILQDGLDRMNKVLK